MNKLKRLWQNNRAAFKVLTDESVISRYEYVYPNAIEPRSTTNKV